MHAARESAECACRASFAASNLSSVACGYELEGILPSELWGMQPCAGFMQAALVQVAAAGRMQMACLALLHAGLAFPAPRLPADFQSTRRCISFCVCCASFVLTHSSSNGGCLAAVPGDYFCRLRQLIVEYHSWAGTPGGAENTQQ